MAAFNLGDLLVSAAAGKLKSVTKAYRNLNIGGITSILGFRLQREIPGVSGSWQERALRRPDPLFAFDWDVTVAGPSGQPFPSEYVEEIDCPNTQTEVDRVFRAGTYIKLAKNFDVPSLTMTVYEDNRATAMSYFRSWFESMHTKEGFVNLPSAYKGKIIVRPRDVKQQSIATFTYAGVFPVNQPAAKFGSSNDRITYSIELSVDTLDMEFGVQGSESGNVKIPLFNRIGKGIETVNRAVQSISRQP